MSGTGRTGAEPAKSDPAPATTNTDITNCRRSIIGERGRRPALASAEVLTRHRHSAVRQRGEVGSVSALWFYIERCGGVPVVNRSVRWLSWVLASAAPAVRAVALTSPPPVSSRRRRAGGCARGPTQDPRSRPSGLPGAPWSMPRCPYGQRPARRLPSLALITVGTGRPRAMQQLGVEQPDVTAVVLQGCRLQADRRHAASVAEPTAPDRP